MMPSRLLPPYPQDVINVIGALKARAEWPI